MSKSLWLSALLAMTGVACAIDGEWPGGDELVDDGKADDTGALVPGNYVFDGPEWPELGDILVLSLDSDHNFYRLSSCDGCDSEVGIYVLTKLDSTRYITFYDSDAYVIDKYSYTFKAIDQTVVLRWTEDPDHPVPMRRRQDELSGEWSGGGWGDVDLRTNGTGTYTGTYGPGPGQISYHRTGERMYAGTWRESQQRLGTLAFTLAADGRTITGTWKPDPASTIGSSSGGTIRWERK